MTKKILLFVKENIIFIVFFLSIFFIMYPAVLWQGSDDTWSGPEVAGISVF